MSGYQPQALVGVVGGLALAHALERRHELLAQGALGMVWLLIRG